MRAAHESVHFLLVSRVADSSVSRLKYYQELRCWSGQLRGDNSIHARRFAGVVGITAAFQRVANSGGEWDARAKHDHPEGDDEPAKAIDLATVGQPQAIQRVSFEWTY